MRNNNNSRTIDLLSKETKSTILKAIRENDGISRLEVSKLTGYSSATVTRVVDSLMNENDLLEEKGTRYLPKGRPMKSLYFKGHNKYAIGIDLGTTFIRGVLSDLNMEVIKEIDVVTEAHKSPAEVFEKVLYIINTLRNTRLIDNTAIIGTGMALAGIINTSTGIIEYSPAFNWRNQNLRKLLGNKSDLPLFFDNVSRVMAIGELQFGKGNRFNDYIMINVGYGIGAGIILNKELFYGKDGMAGEFGHLPVCGDEQIECTCGKNSCLTAYASGDAIAKRTIQKIKEGNNTILTQMSGNKPEKIDAKMVYKAFEEGDKLATDIYTESINYLGMSIAGLINVFNPEAVFIGGGVAMNGQLFWKNLRSSINKNTFDQRSTEHMILPTSNPGRTAIIGATSLILQEVLKLNIPASSYTS